MSKSEEEVETGEPEPLEQPLLHAAAMKLQEVTGIVVRDSVRLPINRLIPQDAWNPQEQDGATFTGMVESIKEIGLAETVLVCGPYDGQPYGIAGDCWKILSGHHKVAALKVAGGTQVSCIVLSPMTDDEIKIYLVKMNALRGNLNPAGFTRLYNDLAKRFDPETLRAKMGMTSDKLFKQLYKDVRKSLPPEIAKKLDQTKLEIHDVDGLALAIKKIFTDHGEQLKYSFLVFEFGGKPHLMIKMSTRTQKNLQRIADECLEQKRDINEVINRLLEQYLPDDVEESETGKA